MLRVSVSILNKLIEEIKSTGQQSLRIHIGYKAYSDLMRDRVFFDEVAGSAMDPTKRTYKKIKIKITQDDYQLEIKIKSDK
ncbi:hypothetical protein B9T31_15795 [Acinetobacter sp. ANC 4558]|nr:hypothetical protein B9T31_15795 [Acinetobacter sp. ANC 4558]